MGSGVCAGWPFSPQICCSLKMQLSQRWKNKTMDSWCSNESQEPGKCKTTPKYPNWIFQTWDISLWTLTSVFSGTPCKSWRQTWANQFYFMTCAWHGTESSNVESGVFFRQKFFLHIEGGALFLTIYSQLKKWYFGYLPHQLSTIT